MLEETIIKLTEAINRAAAAIELNNGSVILASGNPDAVGIEGRRFIVLEEADPVETPTPEVKTPATRKPKTPPTVLPDPTPEETPEAETEKDVEPTPEMEPEPAKTQLTEPVTYESVRAYVQKKLSGDLKFKKLWKDHLAEWKVENLSKVETGDLPDFFEQVKALGN